MFESYTYERLLQDVIDNAPDNIDTRQGSIFYDAVSGPLLELAKAYTDLDLVLTLTQLWSVTGEYLDMKASEYGVTRRSATYAEYWVTFEGLEPDIGERFYYDGIYFTVCFDDDTGQYYLRAEEAGTGSNGIYAGTPAIPVNNIQGLISATFGEVKSYGADDEDDESLRTRVQEKISGPAENGNKQHYKTWCESVDGVGLARIYPLWVGPNTVKAVLIDTTGHGCTESKVAEVQEYIDPATKGYTVEVDGITYIMGDGLGEGVANLGAHFTAAGAIDYPIDVSFKAEIRTGSSADTVAELAREAIEDYLRTSTLSSDEADDVVVRLTTIGSIISGLSPVLDYSDLTLNGDTENIRPGENYVPVIGEVTVL